MWELTSTLTPLEWTLAVIGAVVIGISKGGFAGVGMLGIVLMAFVVPPKESVGLVLPMLIAADVYAVKLFWKDALWKQIGRILPPAIVGVGLGYFGMRLVSAEEFRVVIGGIVLVMIALQIYRTNAPESFRNIPHSAWFAWTMGILAGVSTMMANAAGPVMTLFLLSMGLPKNNFVGTAACFFFIINILKVPLQSQLDLINVASLTLDAILVPFLWLGVWLGKSALQRIRQETFEILILILTALAALELMFGVLQGVKQQNSQDTGSNPPETSIIEP